MILDPWLDFYILEFKSCPYNKIWDIAMLAHESNKQRYIFRGTFRTKFAILRVSHVFVLYLPSRLCTLHFLRGFAPYVPYLRTLYTTLISRLKIFKGWIRNLHCVENVRIVSYSGPYFPVFGLNKIRQSKCGKIQTKITPNTDTFYAVLIKIFKFSRTIKGSTNCIIFMRVEK